MKNGICHVSTSKTMDSGHGFIGTTIALGKRFQGASLSLRSFAPSAKLGFRNMLGQTDSGCEGKNGMLE